VAINTERRAEGLVKGDLQPLDLVVGPKISQIKEVVWEDGSGRTISKAGGCVRIAGSCGCSWSASWSCFGHDHFMLQEQRGFCVRFLRSLFAFALADLPTDLG